MKAADSKLTDEQMREKANSAYKYAVTEKEAKEKEIDDQKKDSEVFWEAWEAVKKGYSLDQFVKEKVDRWKKANPDKVNTATEKQMSETAEWAF